MRENTRPDGGHQVFEHGVFLGGQLDALTRATHLLRESVELKIGDPQYIGALNRRAAHQRLDPDHQLGKVERLGQVVIGAGFEVLDLVLGGVAGGKYQHRQRGPVQAYVPQQLTATQAWQHQIQYQQIVLIGVQVAPALQPVAGDIDREALRAQAAGHKIGQLGVVLDDQ